MGKMLVYLAGPYSADSSEEREENVCNMLDIADKILAMGAIPVVPLLFHWWHLYSPKPRETWLEIDLELLRCCDALFRMENPSEGADCEVSEAITCHIPVYYDLGKLEADIRESQKDLEVDLAASR